MKFKIKALVASLALVAVFPASAAMTSSASGNSSLILTVFDSTGNISATFDLGFDKTTFTQSANNSWNLASSSDYSSAWNTFAAAATMANAQFAVFAGDVAGDTNTAGAFSMFTTGAGTMATISNTSFANSLANFDNYISANNTLGNQGSVANGGNTATAGNGSAYAGVSNAYGGNAGKVANVGSDANGLVGTNLNVWNLASSDGNGLTQISSTKLSVNGFNPYFNLSSEGTLTYVAAVPEADTAAMMLAGLGLIGFVARRRKTI
jgi:hypothetical protein